MEPITCSPEEKRQAILAQLDSICAAFNSDTDTYHAPFAKTRDRRKIRMIYEKLKKIHIDYESDLRQIKLTIHSFYSKNEYLKARETEKEIRKMQEQYAELKKTLLKRNGIAIAGNCKNILDNEIPNSTGKCTT